MILNEEDKQAIRDIVAAEIHQVLRREMAQWWAESLMVLAGYPSHRFMQAQQTGGSSSEDTSGSAGGRAGAPPKPLAATRPRKLGQTHGGPGAGESGSGGGQSPEPSRVDGEYLVRVAESLLRSQEDLAQQLQESMRQLQDTLAPPSS